MPRDLCTGADVRLQGQQGTAPPHKVYLRHGSLLRWGGPDPGGARRLNKASVLFAVGCQAALNMVTRCQSEDFRRHNILVTAIHPGWVRTGMGGEEVSCSRALQAVPQVCVRKEELGRAVLCPRCFQVEPAPLFARLLPVSAGDCYLHTVGRWTDKRYAQAFVLNRMSTHCGF